PRRVSLVPAGRRAALGLEIDPGWRVEGLLQAVGTIKRAGPPDAIDLTHLFRDLDPAVLRHFLGDDRLREDGGEVGWSQGLQGRWVQVGRGRFRKVGQDVVPALRDVSFGEQDLLHETPPVSPSGDRRLPHSRPGAESARPVCCGSGRERLMTAAISVQARWHSQYRLEARSAGGGPRPHVQRRAHVLNPIRNREAKLPYGP